MRTVAALASALALALALAPAPKSLAAEPGRTPPPADSTAIDPDASQALANLNTPGPQHRRLAALVGKWTAAYRVRSGPDSAPVELPGAAEYRMDLGGLFLIGETSIDFGEIKGRGLVIYGFDRFKNRYTFFYIQDHDTQMVSGLGEPSPDGRSVVFDVTVDEPTAGRSARHYRTVLALDGFTQHRFSMSQTLADGRDFTPLEVVYTRVQ